MLKTSPTQIVPLGDLIAAVFDQRTGSVPTVTSDVASEVVADILLRTGNSRALRALQEVATGPS
jgi:hypothetical protein